MQRWGFSVIPISAESKKACVKWKKYQTRRPTWDEIRSWPAANVAVATGSLSGIAIIDCESREDAEWFWKTKGKTKTIVQSRRGFHFYFRHPGEHVKNQQRVEGRYDVRGDGGYALCPPSIHKAGRYQFVSGFELVPVAGLPMFDLAWIPAPRMASGGSSPQISNAVAYISTIVATQGKGGDKDTFRATCRLKDAGMSQVEALAALIEWNKTNAEPPWSTTGLLHKVNCVYGK